MTDLIITLAWLALVTLVTGTLVYALYTFTPKTIDFVKSFIRWHFHD